MVSTFVTRLGDGTSLPSKGVVKGPGVYRSIAALHAGRLCLNPQVRETGVTGERNIIQPFAVVGSPVGSLMRATLFTVGRLEGGTGVTGRCRNKAQAHMAHLR